MRSRSLVALAAGTLAIVLCLLLSLLSEEGSQEVSLTDSELPPTFGGSQIAATDSLASELRQLASRVEALESRLHPAIERTPVPDVGDRDSFELAARVLKLEKLVASLRNDLAPHAPTPEALLHTLDAALPSPGDPLDPVNARRSRNLLAARAAIPLRSRFLDVAPRDPRAYEQLSKLVDDFVMTGYAHNALVAIDRFGSSLSVAPWKLDRLRLNALLAANNWLAASDLCTQIASGEAPDNVRAWAMHNNAQALLNLRQTAAARTALQDLVTTFSGATDPGMQKRVNRARRKLRSLH